MLLGEVVIARLNEKYFIRTYEVIHKISFETSVKCVNKNAEAYSV